MSDAKLTFYDLLGISPAATPDEIQSAYRAVLVKVHPDISRLDNLDTHRLAAAVNEAWLTLKDPEKRAVYDENLKSPGAMPQSPPLGYVMEELSDRGREYVAQLEKSRAHWDEERKRAAEAHEADRLAAEQTAAAMARARETAERVRGVVPAAIPAGEPGGIPWAIGVLIVAVTVALIAAGVLLRPHSGPSSLATPRVGTTAAPANSRANSTRPVATPAGATPTLTTTTSGATQHASPTSKPQLATPPASPLKHAAAAMPQRTAAPARTAAPLAHQALACSGSRVVSIGNGSLIETSDGSYRVDDPLAQQKTRNWSVGDTITICPGTSADGTPNAVLANGVRGTVQAVPVK
jgi:hypothetical protein